MTPDDALKVSSPTFSQALTAELLKNPRWLRALQRVPLVSFAAKALRRRHFESSEPLTTWLHGKPFSINPGNTYPEILHHNPFFNAPLLQLVHSSTRALGRPVCIVDIGAATGDTVYLLEEACPGKVRLYCCVEGDAEFFGYLERNTKRFSNVVRLNVLLADQPKQIPMLVKHHKGTAAAIGEEYAAALPIDALEKVSDCRPDILKVDVDGFDGEVLAGAVQLLATQHPAVIFEWHPKLIQRTGNRAKRSLEVLAKCGYTRYLWFDNRGMFSHFSGCPGDSLLQMTEEYLLGVNSRRDQHYDIVALAPASPQSDIEIAALRDVKGSDCY